MGNFIIAQPSVSDNALITSTNEAGTLSSVNLQSFDPIKIWRSNNLTAPTITIDLGADDIPVRLVSLLYTNATSGATAWVTAADTEGELSPTPPVNTGVISHWPDAGLIGWDRTHFFHWFSSPQVRRWWRIVIGDAGNPAGYYQAGRLYLSDPWQPVRNHDYGWSVEVKDDSTSTRSINKHFYINRKNTYRQMKLSISYETEDELYENAFHLDRTRNSRDVLVIRDPDDSGRIMDHAIYGFMHQSSPIINQRINLFQKIFQVEEMELP